MIKTFSKHLLSAFSKTHKFLSSKANFAAVNHLSGPLRKQKFTSTGLKGHASVVICDW